MFHGDCGLTGKWVEVDIHLNSYRRSNEAIAETVKELVQDFKDKGWMMMADGFCKSKTRHVS